MARILVACEESQAVTKEFRKLGHEAYSCDLLPYSGDHPEWHYQQDVVPLLEQKWDMILSFPPCTYLSRAGSRWLSVKRYGEKAIKRRAEQERAIEFVMKFANANCDYIAIENPIGVISTRWRKPDQRINPYEFGDPYEKQTCLWLKGLPKLVPTNIVEPEPRTEFKSGRSAPTWLWHTCKIADESERRKVRSKTFPGIAKGMATQWSRFV